MIDGELPRRSATLVSRRMRAFRVVVVSGPRQAGKTTMLGQVVELGGERMVSFDRPDLLARATDDPLGFVTGFGKPLAIDEFQRAGNDLLLAVKYQVDRNDERGQFVLAGSTNFLSNTRLADTLAGRVGLVEVLPLSQGEIRGTREQFIDRAFEGADVIAAASRRAGGVDRPVLARLLAIGGYPEVVRFTDQIDRAEFFRSYVDTVTGRESLEDVGALRTRQELRRLIAKVAARTSCEYHPTILASDAGITRQTVSAYVEMLQALYLVMLLPAWSTSATKRAKQASKLHVIDSGLASALTASTEQAMRRPDHRLFGQILETFVATELAKAKAWAETQVELLHFRDRQKREVDLIIEAEDGRIVALEVKAALTVSPKAFTHLGYLRDSVGDRFVAGLVLHGGDTVWRHSDRLWALPLSALWAA